MLTHDVNEANDISSMDMSPIVENIQKRHRLCIELKEVACIWNMFWSTAAGTAADYTSDWVCKLMSNLIPAIKSVLLYVGAFLEI